MPCINVITYHAYWFNVFRPCLRQWHFGTFRPLLTFFILINFPWHVDRKSMDLSFMYIRGHWSKFLIFNIFLSLGIVFILAISSDPDRMPHYATFILGLFTVCQSTCLQNAKDTIQ